MTNKYKISELAKDFGVSSKDIIDIVAEKTGSAKKSGAVLNEAEISVVFSTLINANQVKSFDEYFATGAESREAAKKAREAEKNKKLAEQMAILEQLKAAAAGAASENKPPVKKEEAVEKKEKPKTEEKRKPEPEKAVTAEKPAAKEAVKENSLKIKPNLNRNRL